MVKRPGNSYAKNIFRTIKNTLSRFLAIFAIVGLGVGFLAGLLASPDDMRASADLFCDKNNLYDLKVISTQGLTGDDVSELEKLPWVERIAPAYDTDLVLSTSEDDSVTARLHSLPGDWEDGEYINELTLLSGRMPENPGEVVVADTHSFSDNTDWLGQVLTQEPDEDGELLSEIPETLTVVGTVQSPAYFSLEREYTVTGSGSVGILLYTLSSTFDQDYYTAIYLSAKNLEELNSFFDEYSENVNSIADSLEPIGEERSKVRFESILSDAREEVDDARREYEDERDKAEKELDDALEELEDGEREIAENEETLKKAQQDIEDGWEQYYSGQRELEDRISSSQAQIDNGMAELNSYQTQLDDGFAQIESAQTQLDAARAELEAGEAQLSASEEQLNETKLQLDRLTASGGNTSAALAQWQSAYNELNARRGELTASRSELEQNEAELSAQRETLNARQQEIDNQRVQLNASQQSLNAAKSQGEAELQNSLESLEDAQAEYDDGMAQLEDAKRELEEGRRDYEDAKKEADEKLSNAEKEIDDAEEEIDSLEQGEWIISTREDNASFSSYKSNADKIEAIARVFPVFFFLVAALVALTTMTRMVEEERSQIGLMKALGYSPLRIAEKYLLYALLAGVLGSVAGLLVGMRLFPFIIINAYNIMYSIPEIVTPFNVPLALISSVTAVACTLLATLSACWAELREVPARLMLPKAPKAGKRILLEHVTPIWKRLNFTGKVTARNLFRYKKRFFMTIIGIAGCTALLLTGLGIRDSISDIVDLQFSDLNRYQMIVALKDEKALEDRDLMDTLGENIPSYAVVAQDNGKAQMPDSPEDDVVILAPRDPENFHEFFDFRHRLDGDPVIFDEDSVVITEKLAQRQHVKVGEVFTVKNNDGVAANLKVTDICENYVYHYCYISPKTYEAAFGKPASPNALFCVVPETLSDEGKEELSTELLKSEDVAGVQFTEDISESFKQSIQSIDTIVIVLIVSAGALAFVVLYNLTNINISEREKELATIKVLGFYDNEVSAYIYRETTVLTIIGDLLGLVLGVFLHQFVIRTAEVDIVMFGRSIYPMSFVWAFLLTIAFSILVNVVMARNLKKISMVESLKAPE